MGIQLINNGGYKSLNGLKKFGEISLSMNEGYKKNIIKLFPDLIEIINKNNLIELFPDLIYSHTSLPVDGQKSLFTLPPWWVTGFIDGDGSLSASIKYKDKGRIAFQPSLSISQHKNNILLFNQFKLFFNCGNVYAKKSLNNQYNHIQYQVSSNKNLKSYILPHLKSYPLISNKKEVYPIWNELIELLSNQSSEDRNKKAIILINQISKLNNI